MADPRFSIIPADDDQYDESWKLALLATRPDSVDDPTVDEGDGDDGSGLVALMASCDGRCWYCGCQLTYGGADVPSSITREHQMPRARGGSNKASNIVAACRKCNVTKQAKTVEEFRIYRGGITFHGEGQR